MGGRAFTALLNEDRRPFVIIRERADEARICGMVKALRQKQMEAVGSW